MAIIVKYVGKIIRTSVTVAHESKKTNDWYNNYESQ